MLKKIRTLSLMLGFTLILFSCGDGKYHYKNTIGTEEKTFSFDLKTTINKKVIDSIVRKSILDSQYKLKNPSTFRLSDIGINSITIKDTSILTIDGLKKIKDLELLNINVSFYGKNSFGIESSELSFYKYFSQNGKILNITPLSVSLEIEEKINANPSSYEKPHTIDSTITIRWGNNDYTFIRNDARYNGNEKRNLMISKNNVIKVLEILKTKNGNYKIDKKILDDKTFGLVCGVGQYSFDSEVVYSYEDSYFNVKGKDKNDLIKKLNFILDFAFSPQLKYSKWEVTKTSNGVTETFNK